MRLITSDLELQILLKVLLDHLQASVDGGKYIIFPLETFVVPDEPIRKDMLLQISRNIPLARNANKHAYNFEYKAEEMPIGLPEALRQLGATVYYLATGRSETNDESFLLDGYRLPLNSKMWPAIKLLLSGQATIESVRKLVEMTESENAIEEIAAIAKKMKANEGHIATDEYLASLANQGLKIVRADEVATAWGVKVKDSIVIRYNESTLNEACDANRSQGQQWTLAYYTGQSILSMAKKGEDKKSTYFREGSREKEWWLKPKEAYWAGKQFPPGYYLINMGSLFKGIEWQVQQAEIEKIVPICVRVCIAIPTEIIISRCLIQNSSIQGKDITFWGSEYESLGEYVIIGRDENKEGLLISAEKGDKPWSSCGTLVARNFDF